MGISRKIVLLSWSVTLLTLLIFVLVIIPEQKRIYLQNLESKGRGVAVSLQQVAAGAVVTEDYSTVVDHCKQVLEGDPAIEYLVVTRNDGFSLINERDNWSNETLDKTWRPELRSPQARILTSDLPAAGNGQSRSLRVFGYAMPFSYSGIDWGWIHVGLSLESYDRTVVGIYRRTGLLAVACIFISLAASAGYVRRLVRPILSLQTAVKRVATGDLSARADVRSGDEIEGLAHSFNAMADALRQRDQILQAVRFAAQQFLSAADWNQVLNEALANIGRAGNVSRAHVFENSLGLGGALVSSIRFEWTAPGVDSVLHHPRAQAVRWAELGLGAYAEALQRGEIVVPPLRDIPPESRKLVPAEVKATIAIPIRVGTHNWGFMSFDDCAREREWSAAEVDSFRAAANILGAAIERKQTQDALVEAKENLEARVLKRTKELQEQIEVTERAMAKLAETQQSLMDMSRHAGMAEVATGVLHNVGNVLNSVNVSSTLLMERLRASRIPRLKQLSDLFATHAHDLPAFLTQDPAGRQVTGYLSALADNLTQEQSSQLQELTGLRKNIEHIKDIVAMQQSYAKVSGFIESVSLAHLVDDALNLNAESLRRRAVEVRREYQPLPNLLLDKHRVLQILINLIRNAGHALEERGLPERLLTVRVGPAGPDRVQVEVRDNGVGIPTQNLTRIFQHGFTTRQDGHGFGLHSGALAAREMGGALHGHSDGPDKGATFILELPLTTAAPPLDPATGGPAEPATIEDDEF